MQKTKFFVQQVAKQKAAISGGKVRSVATAVTTSRPAGKIPFQFGQPRTGSMSGKILPKLTAVRGGPSVWAKKSGRIKPLRVVKLACGGQTVKQGGACATCGTAFGQIASPRVTVRSSRRWFMRAATSKSQQVALKSPVPMMHLGLRWRGGA